MKHRTPTTVIRIAMTLAVCIISLMFAGVAIMQESGNSTTAKSGGLLVVTFTLPAGRVKVNLPDDMAAGDTISGTVVAEPSGKTDKEKQRNSDTLQGYVIEFEHQKLPVSGATIRRFAVSPGIASPTLVLLDGKGKQVGVVTVPVAAASTPPSNIQSTGVGQVGRPFEIHGPFDGDSSNTTVKIGSSDAKLLAESPRRVVIESPRDVVGPTTVEVKENNTSTTGQFRNLKIDLTAPKTSLLKGESTELHVQVTGLEGLTQPVNVQLQNQSPSTVQLSGGNTQTQTVRPQDVQTGGVYTWNGNVTGVQSGGYIIVATVPSGIYFQEGGLPGPNDPLPLDDPTKTAPAKDPGGRGHAQPLSPGDPGKDGKNPDKGQNPNPNPNPNGGNNPGGGNSGNNPPLTDCHCVSFTVQPILSDEKHKVSIPNSTVDPLQNDLPVSMVIRVKLQFKFDLRCKGKLATHCNETITWNPKGRVVFKDRLWNDTLDIEGQVTLNKDAACQGATGNPGCEMTGSPTVEADFVVKYPARYLQTLLGTTRTDTIYLGTIEVEITDWNIKIDPPCGSPGTFKSKGTFSGVGFFKNDLGKWKRR